jgi:flagellin-like hook-associated protein FlgL
MVWPESETSFWRRQQNETRGRETAPRSRARTAIPEARSPIAQAIFLCKAQAKFLDKAREALQRMQELAILVQETPPAGCEACLEEFDTLVAFLERLADTEIDGVKLFHNANEIVPLEGDNRLIMAGIDLNSEAYRSVLRVRIATPENATQAVAALQRGLRFIAINREILSSNVAGLFFARDGLDKLKESLQPA